MADITKCSNVDCPIKKRCYRFTATPNEYWQSYAGFKFYNNNCDHFIENYDNSKSNVRDRKRSK